MARRTLLGKIPPRACLCLFLAFAACNSGPPSPGRDKTSAEERKAGFLGSLAVRRDEAARAWGAIVAALPDGLWPTQVTYDGGEVAVAGQALSNNLLADFMSRLEEGARLTGVELRSSVQKKSRTGDYHEFTVTARVADAGEAASPEALEKLLPARPGTADGLRELQRLASDSGLQMTKCVFGQATSGEFAGELPAAVEIAGSGEEIGRYLDGLARLPHFWLVTKLSVRAVAPRDPGSSAKASITVSAWFPN